MKRFKSYLTEHDRQTHDYYPAESPSAQGFGSPDVLRKINAVLGKICAEGPFTLPEEAVRRIRSSLSMMQLSFGEPNLSEDKNSLDKSCYGLVMPVMSQRDDGIIGDIDFGTEVSLAYDVDSNSIISHGESYEIDESLGFKPKYIFKDINIVTSQKTKADKNTNQENLIQIRIRAFQIALNFEKNKKEKSKIEKRIRAFKIALKLERKN